MRIGQKMNIEFNLDDGEVQRYGSKKDFAPFKNGVFEYKSPF